MALVECKECGGQVSDQAAACPHCGAPVKLSLLGREMEEQKVAVRSSVKTQEAQGPVERMPYGDKICRVCGHVGNEKIVTPGSFGMELVLWLLFIVPGLIYSVWRLMARHKACPACSGKQTMHEVYTQPGQIAAKRFY